MEEINLNSTRLEQFAWIMSQMKMPFAKRKHSETGKYFESFISFSCGIIFKSITVIFMAIMMTVWTWAVVLCMNCSFEESWRESMLMMILQLCCPAISPWMMTLMTWMTLTMMIMMMRVFTWKVCQWGRMTSTGGWQRWHDWLQHSSPVTRKFPDTGQV